MTSIQLSLLPKLYPVTVVHHCIRHQYPILPSNVWVVSTTEITILHSIVARNKVRHSVRLNKQKEDKSSQGFRLHLAIVTLHIMSSALSIWPHGRDVVIYERSVAVFLKTIKGVMFDINLTFSIYIYIIFYSAIPR